MNTLLVHPRPKKGQSLDCYLNMLAMENGFLSVDMLIKRQLNFTRFKSDDISLKMLIELTGFDVETLQLIELLPSEQHQQPTNFYGKVALPSYHLRSEQWVCPYCVNENQYCLAKWRIAWLPTCLKHRSSLLCANKLTWQQGKIIDFGKAANDDYFYDHIFQVQQFLDSKLEVERDLVSANDEFYSVVDIVEKQLFRSLSGSRGEALKDRRRKYSRRYFPHSNDDILKFMECLYTQLIQ